MEGLKVGVIGQATLAVTLDQTAMKMGSGSLVVLSTPAMIAAMESACVAAVDHLLDGREATVGIEINVRHLSATPVGETIIAMSEVTEIDGRRIKFEVRAWDEQDLIGEGTHMRYIIDVDNFMERLSENENQADASGE